MRFHYQQGVTLIISLIMLVLITILAVTSFKLGKGNLQIAANAQQHNQAVSAAENVIEQVISKPDFTSNPANAIPNPCNGTANTSCVDINGDGNADVTVKIGSINSSGQFQNSLCVKQAQPVLNKDLNLTQTEDAGCAVGVNQNFGVAGATSGNSMCTDSLWEIDAVATDTVTNATATVTQGVKVRNSNDDATSTNYCP